MSAPGRTLQGRPRLTARAALLFATVGLLATAGVVPVREFLAERAELAAVERQAASLKTANDALRAEIASLSDPTVLEELARACLGMVGRGETALVLPSGSAPKVRC
jgi:cell division protein FtsB